MEAMTPLQERLTRACEELGITCDLDYTANLPSGCKVRAEVRIRGLGADSGMLIVTEYSDVKDISQELVDEGYGFCVLSAPPLPNEDFDLQVYREMFQDWGWSGQEGK